MRQFFKILLILIIAGNWVVYPLQAYSAYQHNCICCKIKICIGDANCFDHVYRDLAKSARVKGFRPGKAPRAVLERMYGASVREEVERLLVSRTFAAAALRSGIVPVVEPDIEAEPPRRGQACRYTAQVEVKPKLELPNLDGLPATRPLVQVRDDEVESELEALRQRRAPLEDEPEEARAGKGSVLTLDYQGRIDGLPFEGGSAEGERVLVAPILDAGTLAVTT